MNEIYHVLNRGVDKRKIFLSNKDYYRFIHDLFEFNDIKPVNTTTYRFKSTIIQSNPLSSNVLRGRNKDKEPLVELHAFCLMPNHYHLSPSPIIEGGMSKYMAKVNAGYVKYFNIKNNRSGTLFESKYKKILIENDKHFHHLLIYIHLNPLDLYMPEWRERSLKGNEIDRCLKFLETYKWSSHLDYLGKQNFPSVTQRKYFL